MDEKMKSDMSKNINILVEKKKSYDKRPYRERKDFIDKNKNDIKQAYGKLIDLCIKDINNTPMLSLDLEEYIKPEGICEGIAIGIGFLDALKKTQLRKFFDQIKDLEHRLKSKKSNEDLSNEDLNKIKIEVLALIPKLAYSKGRDLIDDEFYNFMKALLLRLKNDMNENAKDVFEKFVNILESVLAYYTYHFPSLSKGGTT
ncbi:MAG: type III-A CRISPR-associated protein Csm2 [Hydrogenobaculum sp.]